MRVEVDKVEEKEERQTISRDSQTASDPLPFTRLEKEEKLERD